jgi:hypothetical protein
VEKWSIEAIDFEPHAKKAMAVFLIKNPSYKKMVENRINDLLHFPDLVWQSVFMESENVGNFRTINQQIELAGKAYETRRLIVVTHFAFHR